MRLLVVFVCLVGTLLLSPAPTFALTPSQRFGVGDPNSLFFTDPRYQALRPTVTRLIVRWDVALQASPERAYLDSWYAAALSAHQRPLLAVGDLFARHAPSLRRYDRAVRAIFTRYPKLRDFTPWNEANHRSQPTLNSPALVGGYFRVAQLRCPRCTVTSPSLMLKDSANNYIRQFLRAAGEAPGVWALHNYASANKGIDRPLSNFIRRYRHGSIWMTESAAWAHFEDGYPYDLRRQARFTRTVFEQARRFHQRVRRLYWYEWDGVGPSHRWDSGLVGPDGRPRPAYRVALRQRFR